MRIVGLSFLSARLFFRKANCGSVSSSPVRKPDKFEGASFLGSDKSTVQMLSFGLKIAWFVLSLTGAFFRYRGLLILTIICVE